MIKDWGGQKDMSKSRWESEKVVKQGQKRDEREERGRGEKKRGRKKMVTAQLLSAASILLDLRQLHF